MIRSISAPPTDKKLKLPIDYNFTNIANVNLKNIPNHKIICRTPSQEINEPSFSSKILQEIRTRTAEMRRKEFLFGKRPVVTSANESESEMDAN